MPLALPTRVGRENAAVAPPMPPRSRRAGAWWRALHGRVPPWRMLAVVVAGIVLGDLGNVALQTHVLGATVIWPGNGVLLGVALISPPLYFTSYLATGCLSFVAWNLLAGHPWSMILVVALGKTAAIAMASLVLRRRLGVSTDLARPDLMRAFFLVGVILMPVVPSLINASLRADLDHDSLLALLPGAYLANALGCAILAPLVVVLHREQLSEVLERQRCQKSLLAFGLLMLATAAVFSQNRYPLLFVVMPLMLIVAQRLRLLGASVSCAVVAVIATCASALGFGPLLIRPTDPLHDALLLQVFLATGCAQSYVTAVLASSRRSLELGLTVRERQARFAESRLRQSELLHRVLSENAVDIISRFTLDGTRLYVSPSVFDILGYTPQQLAAHELGAHVHPDDRDAYFAVNDRMRRGEVRIEITYRYARADGTWAWLEARLRLVRDGDGRPYEYISNARDITLQKETEAKLAEAMAELSVLATTDGLTGLANRRRFDETLRKEWRRAMRSRQPVGLVMLDADNFKYYNDIYGHQEGDACLRIIAATLATTTHRPGDLPARYGGEEFCIILPGTPSTGARELGEKVRLAVASLGRPHQRNHGGIVTISVGVASMVPDRDSTIDCLVAAANEALYLAKRLGRNRVEVSPPRHPEHSEDHAILSRPTSPHQGAARHSA